jgi:hypothetical protein
MGGVIAVVMRHEDAERRARGDQVGAKRAHSFGRPGGTNPRVEDEALAFSLDDDAVASRSGSESKDTHGEAPSVLAPARRAPRILSRSESLVARLG